MKKLLILLAFAPSFLFAQLQEAVVVSDRPTKINLNGQIFRTNTEIDSRLATDESMYTFKFNVVDFQESGITIKYSIDGKNKKKRKIHDSFSIKAKPGKHIFQFYYNQNYLEVYSDSLLISAQHNDTYMVQFFKSLDPEQTIQPEKPVIYLYPQLSTEVSVKIDVHGKNAFLYPPYVDSWDFTAEPNGDLHFGEETYNYLFWESTINTIISNEQRSSGFFVEGENVVHFLEDKLTLAGLNSKEQADFITYWGPRLAQNELNFVHFEFNETCAKYAELNISPKPDNLYRIFMTWGAVSERFDVKEQEIESFDRSGFSVLEWGGQETYIKQPLLVKKVE